MPLPKLNHQPVWNPPQDEDGLRLWRIACRADELVQQTGGGPGSHLVCWLIAEREVTGHWVEAAMLVSHEHLKNHDTARFQTAEPN